MLSNRPKGTQLGVDRDRIRTQVLLAERKIESRVGEANGFGVLATNTGFSVDLCEHLNSLYKVLHVVFRAIQHAKKRLSPASAPLAPITHTLKSAE